MSKNWKFSFPMLQLLILGGFVGAITTGCVNFTNSNLQQTDNIASVQNQRIKGEREEGTSSNTKQVKNREVRANDTSTSSEKLNLKEGMLYQRARKLLLKQGWEPNLQGDAPNLGDTTVKELYDLGYKEIKDCSGTGEAPCRLEFVNKAGELLFISTRIGESNSNSDRVVWRWWLDKEKNANQQTSVVYKQDKPPFTGTKSFNFLGGSGTAQSIGIAPDGTTIVTLHGKFESVIQYNGKFSNPIKLQDGSGFGLLLKDNRIYSLSPNGEIAKNCKGEGTLCESDLSEREVSSSAQTIKDGYYVLGGTGQGLEVRGERYRFYDEEGNQEWRLVSQLTPIKENVVFDGKNYWCIPPRREVGVCTENGWNPSR